MPHKDPEKRKEYQKQYGKRYKQENKESCNAYNRKWRNEHKEHVKQYSHDYRQKHLKEHRDSEKKRYPKLIQDFRQSMNNLKINGCAICGYDKCNNSLDFHHVDPIDKEFTINVGSMSYGNKKLVDEINKCILLCKNCHYEIHEKGRNYKENDKK